MEILNKYKQNGYFTAELYHLLTKKKLTDGSEPIIPSEYLKEMNMTTQQRLQNLNGIEVENLVSGPGKLTKKIVLSFTPRVVVFQNYKTNERITTKISVKNISKSPTFLNMEYKESSYFSIKPCGGQQLLSRLAPGISVNFMLTFTPIHSEDYIHKISFFTDVDKYVVVFIGMGPRPTIDFPDQLSIPETPLKVQNDTFLTVHNTGLVAAGFTLTIRSPFSVQPKSAYLNPKEKVNLKVGFKTMTLGETCGVMYAKFETGETFVIQMTGKTHTARVALERYIVRFSDTFNTMVRQQTFKIINKSEHSLTYMCMKNESVYEDFQDKLKLATIFYKLKDSEAEKDTKLVQYDVASSEEHERVYTRIFFDEIHSLVADESLQFQNTHFSITPIKGTLWPNKTTELTMNFAPQEIGEFSSVAFLDIDGVSSRIPITLTGTSLPPLIQLNLETLDMNRVYINKTYNYEIVAINKGHINGVIVYKEIPTLFGSRITCSPEIHYLRPGDKEIFVISFCNSNQGPYFEEINFDIRETKVVLKVYLKGEVIYPSVMFSIPCLDFGMVSLGVPVTRELEVVNESVVDVSASVKISSDGPEISSITLEDYAVAYFPKPTIPTWPREFKIIPCKIDIGSESRITLRVILNANLARANQTYLELELEKSDSPPIILPVMYNAMVPELTVSPDIKMRACFLDYTYTQEITITANGFWGYFTLDESPDRFPFEVDVKLKEAIIKPNSTIIVPVDIKTSVLGVQEHTIRINVFGLSKPIEICHVTGCGVRPIVTCTPIALHWGQVKLLMKSQKTLTLCNDSPVVVKFRASLLNRDGRWTISPTEGFIKPEGETDLTLSLYLIDADNYMNKAVIQLEKVKDILIPISATGVGTSIMVGPLRDNIFLGRNFTKIPLNCKVVVENFGTRLHSLEWSEYFKPPKSKPHTMAFYSLDPKVFKIAAGEKIEMTITGISYKVTTIREVWYLIGSVEGINKKELLLECPIVAEFVDPKIELSSCIMNLQYDYGPYSEFYKLTDIISIKNVSKLPLDIDISVKPPFAIIQKKSTYKIPPDEEDLCCCMCYDENDLNLVNIIKEVGDHQSKTFIDCLTLKPVEPLRKEPLNFFQNIHKIKMAFNITHSVEERLEDQDVMKLQILLDTTKHLSLKSRIYCDLMRIKFKGHKNKDAVKLIGTINFPNILVLTPRIDFQCMLNGSIQSKTIKIQNVTPLFVCYRLQWRKCWISNVPVPQVMEPIKIISDTISTVEEMVQDENTLDSLLEHNNSIETGVKCSNYFLNMDQNVTSTPVKAELTDELMTPIPEDSDDIHKLNLIDKIAPMIHPEYEAKFSWFRKFPPPVKHFKIKVNEMIQLCPHRGLLKPNEIQYIQVIFRPRANINVKAILECEVLGGPPEIITITGQSSDLIYKINTKRLNYKIISFHENAFEIIVISNVTPLPFEYKTYLNEPKFENDLEGTILELIPSEKVLGAEEETELKVVMRPGVVGYFNRTFLIKIGHFPSIPIEVFGWGQIPQVYSTLPRPKTAELPLELGYEAIPLLTSEYLEAINEIFHKTEQHPITPLTDTCFEDPDLLDGWHICSVWDEYPSVMDIELSIERVQVIKHIKNRPEMLSAYSHGNKMGPIPGFFTTPYVINYGVVITGSTVQYSADIINYGPIAAKIYLAKGTVVPKWLTMKLCGKLNPGESGKIEIVFTPSSEDFTELEQNVETCLNFEVPYGVTLPIQIKALCAVPYLTSNVSEIKFGLVRCGDKVICSIPLKNVGKPTCIWYVTLRLKAHGSNPMTILDSSGKYEPGEGGWLSVAFKPTMDMLYEGMLIFRFHMNPNRMTIPISGQGIVPIVHIIGPEVKFPPTLPWSDTTEIFFGLTNPCPFPIELIIAHSDQNWKEEEEVYELLYKYYNKPEEMLVPVIRPGKRLPVEVLNFLRNFKDRVRIGLEEAAALKNLSLRGPTASKKAPQKSPKGGKALSSKEMSVSPRKIRNESEIIADEIRLLKDMQRDPLKDCLHVFDSISTNTDIEKVSKGIIIFFYGSPCEEVLCKDMAYSVGKTLKIPVFDIDLCVIEALCTLETHTKSVLIDAINESYEIAKRNAMHDHDESSEGMDFNESDDLFTQMQKKIEYLAVCKTLATPRSKTSDKKKKRQSTSSLGSNTCLAAMGSTTMFQMDLVEELLTDFFKLPKFDYGFIIDSLNSIVLKSPSLVMTTVLRCKHTIRDYHLVLGQADFSKWAQTFEEAQKENEVPDDNVSKVYLQEEIDEIVNRLEDMDEEEYEAAPEELKAIYITYGLENRRKKYYMKRSITSMEAMKKDKTTGKDHSFKSLLTMDRSESKKKIKKEDTAKGKPNPEYLAMQARYIDYYKNTYEAIINIANNWVIDELDVGMPLVGFNGQVLNVALKKAKKKSDTHLQASDIPPIEDRGFPITFLMYPCLRYRKALVTMFSHSPEVQKALKVEEEHDILKDPVEAKEFTVLLPKVFPQINHEDPLRWCYLEETPIKKCECNQLTDINLLDDTNQDNVLNILSKWHCVCGKKLASTKTSTTEIPSSSLEKSPDEETEEEIFYPTPAPLHQLNVMDTITTRLVLEPNDLVRCKYTFNPQTEGVFSVKRFVEVYGWPDSRVEINVNAICDIPRLDSRPKKMFDNFVRRTIEDKVYKTTYLDDQKIFEFGPIFIGRDRIYEEEYTMDLRNSSLITANVVIEFLDETTVFEIDKNFIELEPGARGKLTISAAPAVVGVHTIKILFCVKDNPEIVTVTIGCSGVLPMVEILPITKNIEYGKLLLYRREDDRFIVKNDSILPIMWKIANGDGFIEDFIISKLTGIVPRHDNQVVPVTYIACRVGVISSKVLTINIYDELGRGEPMVTDNLYLSAECYDVMVDCAYENPAESSLNYGNVKVNSTVLKEMYLLNRGKYNIFYKLKKIKNFPEPSLLRSFEAAPECGLIPPVQKLVCIEFECTPTTSINLVNEPAYTCSLLDGSNEQVVVAKFPVCVTIASFYNTFTLFPLGELNFHIIAVGCGIAREVILSNTSKCPFTYEIILPEVYRIDPEAPLPQKTKDNKIKNPPLKCGNFIIMNEDNLLTPGTSRTISIQFLATAPRKFEETINFVISDTCPAESQGVPLRLVGTGAMPVLDFWNIETTFREHLIVKNLDEYKVHESSPHCVFTENSVTLHFFSVNVNSKYVGYIDLYNNGLVACVLTMNLVYPPETGSDIFSLDKYEAHIEPLLHKNLGIIFTPKALTEYRAVLQIRLKLLDNREQFFKLCLVGEGVIPRVRLLNPIVGQHRFAMLEFPVTCLGSISTRKIRIKNISSVKSIVSLKVYPATHEQRKVFWLNATENCERMLVSGKKDFENLKMKVKIDPEEIVTVVVSYNPIKKGKTTCDVKINIIENPYEYFNILCEAEGFMEDVVLIGLKMLSMDIDIETFKNSTGTSSTASSKSRKRSGNISLATKKKKSVGSMRDIGTGEPSLLKYLLNFGGCEVCAIQKRSVIMANNSEKVYKFVWDDAENIVIKPSTGYISPGEEKDLELMFFVGRPVCLKNEVLSCKLTTIEDDCITMDVKGTTWDNRQIVTLFEHKKDMDLNERCEVAVFENVMPVEDIGRPSINIVILYSATTQHAKYNCTLKDEKILKDTYIYQVRRFTFELKNTGSVPLKTIWNFTIDEEFPSRIDKKPLRAIPDVSRPNSLNDTATNSNEPSTEPDASKVTLYSQSSERDSVDTWFEVDLPFKIEPAMQCISPGHSQQFTVTFSPLDAFDFNVRLKSLIDNLDPYDQNVCCRIVAKSLIPFVHLDIEESDYLTSNRRKEGVALSQHTSVLEFNVLGWGCYKKTFSVINPTEKGYEFVFENTDMSEKMELIPVHCDTMKGFVEGGTSNNVTFTFAPTAPGTYESMWKFVIPQYEISMDLLVVGLVREPEVVFVPTILIIRNSLVGFTTTNMVTLKNPESDCLSFEFKGNSLCNESGKTPCIVEPEKGILKPNSETQIKITYTPIQDGPLSFKIFCSVAFMTKFLTLCVNALSYLIKPTVTYFIIGNEHILNSEVVTNIHLNQTASTYERMVPFKIKNDGSASFLYEWNYINSAVKKYLQVYMEPKSGYVAPGEQADCVLHFTLKQVPVQAFPITLCISDGPEYSIFLYADIRKPDYHFLCTNYDFGKCIVNAPDTTYQKDLVFTNDDKETIILDLNFRSLPELYVDYHDVVKILSGKRHKIPVLFRPKQIKEYEFKLQFWVNSLCEEIVTIKGEGVPLLFDLYEGCQKSFDLGPVKVGEKITRTIDVINHSKVAIDASFIFKDMYPVIDDDAATNSQATSVCLITEDNKTNVGPSRVKMLQSYEDNKIKAQIEKDIQNALSSLRVIPNKCHIDPYRKSTLKIQFKPVGMISNLNVQLNMKVLSFERPLVKLSGSATGMSLCLSQNSLQFGRVRKRGCKILKVMLLNKGDFGTRFWWQPLKTDEFSITPLHGSIAAHTNVTFTITFRPTKYNTFIKVWASCNIENYQPQDLAMYASCMDVGSVQNKTLFMECPVREVVTDFIIVTNPSDDVWLVLSEISGGPFDTLREFTVEPNSNFNIPVNFRPKTIGKHEAQFLFSPLGELALFVTVSALASAPNPNGDIYITVPAKEFHTENLMVYNITEAPETYIVDTEILKIVPDKFVGYHEIKQPDLVRVWGEASATCRWTYVCYEACEMTLKVMFINQKTREYQFYNLFITVVPSQIVDTIKFVARARETQKKEVMVKNSLAESAEYTIRCEKMMTPDSVTVGKKSQAIIALMFSPLVVGKTEDFLEVYNSQAGSYIYKILMTCLPAKEKEINVTTSLGSCVPLRLRVQNRTDLKTDFITTVSEPCIIADPYYSIAPLEKEKFLVWFEPIDLGQQNCAVSFDSPLAGEFAFNIKGIATDPKPQGPYLIKAGGFNHIKFKNVFIEQRTFRIYCDTEDFYVRNTFEIIRPKMEVRIPVNLYDSPRTGSEMPTGVLTIETHDPPTPRASWTFFLQGQP